MVKLKKQLVTFNVTKINILSFVMFFIAAIIAEAFQLAFFKDNIFKFRWWDMLVVLAAYIALIAAHEGIHAVTMLMVGVNPNSIKFGAIPKQMMFYCTTDCPVKAWQYSVVLLTPLIFTGIIPLILATVYLGIPYVMLFALLVSGGAGDVVMFMKIIRYPCKQLVQDHPSAPAFYLLYPEDKLPADFKEVTEEEEKALRSVMYGKNKEK